MLSFGIGWLLEALSFILISLFDYIIYWTLAASYNVFAAICRVDLFAKPASKSLYEGFAQRIYSIIGIVMLFVIAYQIILYIINPDDSKASKGASGIIKDVVISILLAVIAPLGYRYMSEFQIHVVEDNVIPSVILGTKSDDSSNAGKQLSMITYSALFHPKGMSTNDFIDDDGNVRSADDACSGLSSSGSADMASEEICKKYAGDLQTWANAKDARPGELTGDTKLTFSIGEDGGMDYLWILAEIAGVAVIWFIFSYAISVGTRQVKLAFLEIIGSIPIMFRIFKKDWFNNWIKEVLKTYLELFARIAIITFVVYVCTLVPQFVAVIFQ